MKLPSIHLNGTSREALVKQMADVVHALDEALTKVGYATPHGRDYYVQGNGEAYPPAYQEAVKEHEDRLKRLLALRNEYEALGLAIQDLPGYDRRRDGSLRSDHA